MQIVDVGGGTPIVLVPGIQGRWEWMKPTVETLANRCRVISFSLCDEPTCSASFDASRGFDAYVEQISEAMDQARVPIATICGVSYGGLIAAAFAARYPERTSGLVLVSAIPPSWKPDDRVRFYLRAPRLLSPLFCIASVRLYKEIAAAHSGVLPGIRAALRYALTAATHMFSPTLMARRARLLDDVDVTRDLASVQAPVLVITGDGNLERVVPVHRTHEYLALWPWARTARLPQTGHLGLITKPEEFADLVVPFAEAADGRSSGPRESRRRIG